MPIDKKNKLQTNFLKQVGGNVEAFLLLLDVMTDTAAYLKDRKGRIMFLNTRNCENCNVKNISDAVGKTSYDLFPETCAKDYADHDDEVMRTGKPMFNMISFSPDLTTKLVCTSRVPLFGKNRHIIGVAAIYRLLSDINEIPEWFNTFSDVAAFINTRYAETISIDELARMAHCSSSQFRRRFKRFFKMTPMDYILLTRINAAREMLEHSTRLIADIAQAVGFCDHSHFIRTFKRFRGITPHQYRLQHLRRSATNDERKSLRSPDGEKQKQTTSEPALRTHPVSYSSLTSSRARWLRP